MRITETYDRVRATARRRVVCDVCGQKRYIQRTFTATVNPFNRNVDGTPRSAGQVQSVVNAQARDWEPDENERVHEKCFQGYPWLDSQTT
jgi:hypothetical protein